MATIYAIDQKQDETLYMLWSKLSKKPISPVLPLESFQLWYASEYSERPTWNSGEPDAYFLLGEVWTAWVRANHAATFRQPHVSVGCMPLQCDLRFSEPPQLLAFVILGPSILTVELFDYKKRIGCNREFRKSTVVTKRQHRIEKDFAEEGSHALIVV